MKSKRSVLANKFGAQRNWSCTKSERDLAGTHGSPMVILGLLAWCALPSANQAQVPVYEVTPMESTIKFGVESSVPIKGSFDKMERKHEVFVHGREERCVGHRDSGGQRGHRQRHEKQKIEEQGFF